MLRELTSAARIRNSKFGGKFKLSVSPDDDESRLRIVDEPASAGGATAGAAPPRRPASGGNRLDASIVKLRERQLLLKREQAC